MSQFSKAKQNRWKSGVTLLLTVFINISFAVSVIGLGAKKYPGWHAEVIVYNGDKLKIEITRGVLISSTVVILVCVCISCFVKIYRKDCDQCRSLTSSTAVPRVYPSESPPQPPSFAQKATKYNNVISIFHGAKRRENG